jgi:hypothetical protein
VGSTLHATPVCRGGTRGASLRASRPSGIDVEPVSRGVSVITQ